MPGVTKLSTRIASLLAVAVLWPIAAKIVNTLLLMDAENQFDWVMLLVTIFFLAIILWLLYLVYQAAPPVLQAVSRGRRRSFVRGATLPTPQRLNSAPPVEPLLPRSP
jgi:hypothetical protein